MFMLWYDLLELVLMVLVRMYRSCDQVISFRYHEIIVTFLYVVSCLCMVFLLGLGSCLLHVQVRERKKWSHELESLRGDVYMDGWPARCGDRVDRGLSSFQFV